MSSNIKRFDNDETINLLTRHINDTEGFRSSDSDSENNVIIDTEHEDDSDHEEKNAVHNEDSK
jgi:hypothetical protein